MIEGIKGILVKKSPEKVLMQSGGIVYGVNITLRDYDKLPQEGDEFMLFVDTVFSENGVELYGFVDEVTKSAFKKIRNIRGFGPRLARSLLSGISVDEFGQIIEKGEVEKLQKVPGIGKKTAQRIIFEMKGKLDFLSEGEIIEDRVFNEVCGALQNLGIKTSEAKRIVSKLRERFDNTEDLLREALKELVK